MLHLCVTKTKYVNGRGWPESRLSWFKNWNDFGRRDRRKRRNGGNGRNGRNGRWIESQEWNRMRIEGIQETKGMNRMNVTIERTARREWNGTNALNQSFAVEFLNPPINPINQNQVNSGWLWRPALLAWSIQSLKVPLTCVFDCIWLRAMNSMLT